MIALAERNAERLDHLINDIFDAEKLGSGQIELQLAPLALHQLALHCLEATRTYAAKQRVQLQLESPAVDGPMVHADGARLRQALTTLVGNAVKFSPPGAQSASASRSATAGRGSRSRIVVPGIPQAFRDRILRRFVPAEAPQP